MFRHVQECMHSVVFTPSATFVRTGRGFLKENKTTIVSYQITVSDVEQAQNDSAAVLFCNLNIWEVWVDAYNVF